ncbi:membrane protein [Longimycelium tulufanense]|uniref:Membrane protein n=1 Tax=Longimycelium tulufanense TaxID=907463 RepID=A0A8J3FXP0_9PSEU|nr:metal-dependent hydrolase [Longimycelium tulufanense]GGM75723.1 membrane protein [Longimycelium tulufanense]
MLGRTHALTGWCAGLALAPALGLDTLSEVVPFAAVTAGYALVPDLDHPGSRASRLLGVVTGAVSRLLRTASTLVYRLTKGPRDERGRGMHRHLSHTVVFAVALGFGADAATTTWGRWALLVILALGLLLSADALGNWLVLATGGAVVMVLVADGDAATALNATAEWAGVAVAVGCIVHCLGDALTRSGCPFLWPIPIAGETFYEIRPPRWLRFRTGGPVEQAVIFPACAVAGVLLVPGVWKVVVDIVA